MNKFSKFKYEAGIDEAGRGSLAGPVTAAAVILGKDLKNKDLNDSKKLSPKKRLELKKYIEKNALAYSVAFVNSSHIDKNNILNSTFKAMHMSLRGLDIEPNFILVDGNLFKPYRDLKHKCIIKGDQQYQNIAAASILAKVERDKYINEICKKYPLLNTYYDLNNNKGYGTAKHMEGIKKYGISPWHRTTYGICKTSEILSYDLFNQSLHE